MPVLTRRIALLGGLCTLGGCSTISSLNAAAEPLDTYDLFPVSGSTSGRRTSRTLLVARPQASAALNSDRIMVRPDTAAITYLPDARWTDELPAVLQSLLIRSISGTGRIGYVGPSDAGPIPDKALLVRIDRFDISTMPDGFFQIQITVDLTVINDKDQRVTGNRSFTGSTKIQSDSPKEIVAAFQNTLNPLLPEMAEWTLQRM